jgi:hypothetical protein
MKHEKTPAVAALLQPNSLIKATKKTENEYQIPNIINRLRKDNPTITHP